MKILFYDMGSYTYQDCVYYLKRLGHVCKTVYYHFPDKYQDDFFCRRFSRYLEEDHYDAVMSVNFFPLVAKLCSKYHIKYLSWCYDSPLEDQLSQYFSYETNYIFLFDRLEAAQYQASGYSQIFHMPLAVNTERLQKLVFSQKQISAYHSDISFVGHLYEPSLDALLAAAPEYIKGYIEGILQAQLRIYGYYFLEELITDELLQAMNSSFLKLGQTKLSLTRKGLAFAIACAVTHFERSFLLNEFSEHYLTTFYTTKPSSLNAKVRLGGPLKYHTEMPGVFRYSKINLCPALKCISSGIPLRALDIMGSGGFLLSSYQPELAEYFENDSDCAMYASLEEAFDKADFYIRNDASRDRIRQNGFQKVKAHFDYPSRIKDMFRIAGLS